MIDKLDEISGLYMAKAKDSTWVLDQLKVEKVGNCYENAKAAEIILKMNGVKHAKSASLVRGKIPRDTDHFVCVFNRDGSVFDGTVKNNQTIIVDPLFGKVDFANNMFKMYENTCQKSLKMPAEGKFGFDRVVDTKISDEGMETLKQKFKNLLYKK